MKYPGVRQRGKKPSFAIKYSINGKSVYETVNAPSAEAANLIRMQRILASGPGASNTVQQVDFTFAQAFDVYFAFKEKSLKENTRQRSRCIFNHFLDFVQRTYPNVAIVRQVSTDLGESYKHYMLTATAKTPSGINTDITKLRAIFKVFLLKKMVDYNPFSKVEKLTGIRAKPKEKHLPSDLEVLALLHDFDDDKSYCGITKYILHVGRRINESTSYFKKDVVCDMAGKPIKLKIRAEIAKTGVSEELELDDELSDIVQGEMLKFPKVPYLFVNEWGRKISPNTYRDALLRVCNKNSIPTSTPHCFRYYVINKLMATPGMNIKDAMAITGHIDIESFLSYLKSTPEGRKRAMEACKLANIK